MTDAAFVAVFTLINVALLILNVVILGCAVKLYSEATKTHIFTRKPERERIGL